MTAETLPVTPATVIFSHLHSPLVHANARPNYTNGFLTVRLNTYVCPAQRRAKLA